jgi:ribosomal protein L11 methylase PrmA
VGPGDVFHDLGCGDGRLVIAAARRGARAIGTEIDPSLVARCRQGALDAGIEAEFRLGDMFVADLHDATVVTLYLYSTVNLRLRPKLQAELRPGTRLVSHSFAMGDWEPDEVVEVDTKFLHLWIL